MIDLNVVLAHASPHGKFSAALILTRDEVTDIVCARMNWE